LVRQHHHTYTTEQKAQAVQFMLELRRKHPDKTKAFLADLVGVRLAVNPASLVRWATRSVISELVLKLEHGYAHRRHSPVLASLRQGEAPHHLGRPPLLGDLLEQDLLDYILDLNDRCVRVPPTRIRVAARALAADYGIPETEFKASRHWLWAFMRRHHLSRHLGHEVRLSARIGTISRYRTEAFELARRCMFEVWLMRDRLKVKPSNVWNLDETGIAYELSDLLTVAPVGARHVRVITSGKLKKRCTAVLIASSGGVVLPPLLIFPRKSMATEGGAYVGKIVSQDFAPLVPGEAMRCVTVYSEAGWVTSPIYSDLLRAIAPWVGAQAVLLHDEYKVHQKVAHELGSELPYYVADIPAGLTAFMQPLDLSFFGEFKEGIRRIREKQYFSNPFKIMSEPEFRETVTVSVQQQLQAQLAHHSHSARLAGTFVAAGLTVDFQRSKHANFQLRLGNETSAPIVRTKDVIDLFSDATAIAFMKRRLAKV
jgi:hypothetical protein